MSADGRPVRCPPGSLTVGSVKPSGRFYAVKCRLKNRGASPTGFLPLLLSPLLVDADLDTHEAYNPAHRLMLVVGSIPAGEEKEITLYFDVPPGTRPHGLALPAINTVVEF